MLRYRRMEGNEGERVDNMRGMWENTEAECRSTYAKLFVCEEIRRLFEGVRRVFRGILE